MRRYVLSAIVVATLALAGCGGSNSGSSQSSPAPSPGDSSRMEIGGAVQQPAKDQAPTERQEIITGQVALTAGDPVAVGRQIVDKVDDLGGRIDQLTEQPGSDGQDASSSLTIRVPADSLTRTLDDLRELGKVTSVSVTKSDVTMQSQDLDARIGALTASVTRLQGLITSAANTADLIEAEKALSERQGELDSLTAQKRSLSDQVALATIMIDVTTTDAERPSTGPDNFWEGVVAGWNALLSAIAAGAVVVGALIPWFGFVAVIALVVYGAYRLRRMYNRPPSPPSGPAPEREEAKTP
ncbi:DUF4349 domain-containing protein [Rhodococcus sp. NCIMB 12038]|uniref:DUF4349 domain-containing protein n=1 Tax=Rhodococcus sp. NCIMB 12038 TaxID=933800 RepID=UPI000B3CF31A|nr:DUF4349 domain-containing protein [Rhodococcus sp. NCIMB 12038]OUS94051.1 hypothetical protein CA951_19420 [Rhodococcus sp. NCIMB 12038]